MNLKISLQVTIIFLLYLIVFQSCSVLKPGSKKSSKNLYETFYIGEEGIQYFIKPFSFGNINTKGRIDIDFTFRYKNEVKDSAILNLSIYEGVIIKSLDSIKFRNNVVQINQFSTQLMYNEVDNDFFKSRYTTKIPLNTLNKLFGEENWTLYLYSSQGKFQYQTGKKTSKFISSLNKNLFVLMR